MKDVLTALTAGGEKEIDRFLTLAERLAGGAVTEPTASPARVVATPTDSAKPTAEDTQEYVRLRAGLSQRIQRNIDGLQIATTFWWRRVLRGLAFTICGVLGLSLFKGRITYAGMSAIVGLFVATASRDLIAVVEKARR